MDVHDSLRDYWDKDAETYNLAPSHVAHTKAEHAAWSAALLRHLPPPPAHVLDVGAGTGALSLPLARLGYRVTALDLSPRMLGQLRATASSEKLELELVEGPAESPPGGPFGAVTERLLLWTLADPRQALRAWRAAAPGGRLLSFGGLWGSADRVEARRELWRQRLHRLRRRPPEHHDSYGTRLSAQLPFSSGMTVEEVVEAVGAAGWGSIRLARLRDLEWARVLALPIPERLLGVTPEFVVVADDPRA